MFGICDVMMDLYVCLYNVCLVVVQAFQVPGGVTVLGLTLV